MGENNRPSNSTYFIENMERETKIEFSACKERTASNLQPSFAQVKEPSYTHLRAVVWKG